MAAALTAIGSSLPVSIEDLIHARSVEDNRREFKAAWNPATQAAVVRTICAFANDLLNLNGGYVILGVEADANGNPGLPPRGLENANVDTIQREILGQCNRIHPRYRPVLFPVVYHDRLIVVVWAPGGDYRPYEAPRTATTGDRAYYVREGSQTVAAKGPLRSQLFEQAAKIPFDDRTNRATELENVSDRGESVPAVPARNRRIGGFLKELKLAESRGTGVPKIRRHMSASGSPEPRFDFDEAHAYFRVVLPVHPRYRVIHALRESALLWATGKRREALNHLLRVAQDQPGSGAVTGQIIEYAGALEDLDLARTCLQRFESVEDRSEGSQPYLRYASVLLNRGYDDEARRWLSRVPVTSGYGDLLDAAILSKRARDYREAHRLFEGIYPRANDDPKVVQEFAQTKLALASALRPSGRDLATKKTLNRQAAELLRRAIPLTDDPTRKAWCWFDLARTLAWLREANSDVEPAYRQALSLKPDDDRFRDTYRKWKSRRDR